MFGRITAIDLLQSMTVNFIKYDDILQFATDDHYVEQRGK